MRGISGVRNMVLLPVTLLLLNSVISAFVSKRRQFKEMDKNSDKTLTVHELAAWIIFQDIEYQNKNAEDLFRMNDKNGDNRLSWEEYAPSSFGATLHDECMKIYEGRNLPNSGMDPHVYQAIKSAARRWKAAGGRSMTTEEFKAFAYPELYQHMRHVAVEETIERYDSNKDGEVSVKELLQKKYKVNDEECRQYSLGMYSIGDTFTEGLVDINKDGIFDKNELGDWTMENRRLIHKHEARDIFQKMDSDKNTRLSYQEYEKNSHFLKLSFIGHVFRDEL